MLLKALRDCFLIRSWECNRYRGHVGNLRFEMLSSFGNATLISLLFDVLLEGFEVFCRENKRVNDLPWSPTSAGGTNNHYLIQTPYGVCVCGGWFRRIPFMCVWESTILRCPISHDIPIFLLKPCLYFDTLLKPADLYPQQKKIERAIFFRDSAEKPLGSQSFVVFRGI